MSEQWIRASEIGGYLYCRRSWWLRHVNGVEPGNTEQLAEGTNHHRRHAYWVAQARFARRLAILFAVVALAFLLFWLWG